jgi:hypothetical protein
VSKRYPQLDDATGIESKIKFARTLQQRYLERGISSCGKLKKSFLKVLHIFYIFDIINITNKQGDNKMEIYVVRVERGFIVNGSDKDHTDLIPIEKLESDYLYATETAFIKKQQAKNFMDEVLKESDVIDAQIMTAKISY